MKSFAVSLWANLFHLLRWISLFQVIRSFIPATKRSYFFVDAWVFSHFLFSVIFLLVSSAPGVRWWELIIIYYGVSRVFEIFIYQINVLLFDEFRALKAGKKYALRGYRRLIILTLQNYIEVIAWFAILYRNIEGDFNSGITSISSFFGSLNYSFVKMTNFGLSDLGPVTCLGNIIVFIQSILGLFMAMVILARFISLIPSPETMDEFEK